VAEVSTVWTECRLSFIVTRIKVCCGETEGCEHLISEGTSSSLRWLWSPPFSPWPLEISRGLRERHPKHTQNPHTSARSFLALFSNTNHCTCSCFCLPEVSTLSYTHKSQDPLFEGPLGFSLPLPPMMGDRLSPTPYPRSRICPAPRGTGLLTARLWQRLPWPPATITRQPLPSPFSIQTHAPIKGDSENKLLLIHTEQTLFTEISRVPWQKAARWRTAQTYSAIKRNLMSFLKK